MLEMARLLRPPQHEASNSEGTDQQQQEEEETEGWAGEGRPARPVVDLQAVLCGWFMGAHPQLVKRGNVAELLAYGFHDETL